MMSRRSLAFTLLAVIIGSAVPSQAGTYSKKYFVTNNSSVLALKSNPKDDFGNPGAFGNPVATAEGTVGYTGVASVDDQLEAVYDALKGTPLNDNFLSGTPADQNFLDDPLPVPLPAWPLGDLAPAPGPYSTTPGNTNIGGVQFTSFAGTPVRISIKDASDTPIRWSACAVVGNNAGGVCGDADDLTTQGCGTGSLIGWGSVREINVWIIGNDSAGIWDPALEPCDGVGTWGTITLTTS